MTTAAKLTAGALAGRGGADWAAGYEWVIGQLSVDHPHVASELQICRALEYLRHKQFEKAIEQLKAFERKDVWLKARAAVNLSFLYFHEGDVAQASRHAHLAVRHDRYNAKALVNLGNCLLESKGELERAKELYLEAIGVEADCAEAIFNLGLVNRQLGALGEALQAFEKLHTIVPSSPEVIRHIASLHEQLGNPKAAAKYYSYLLTRVPTDAGALAYLGQMAAKDEDEAQAYHFHSEACGISRAPAEHAGCARWLARLRLLRANLTKARPPAPAPHVLARAYARPFRPLLPSPFPPLPSPPLPSPPQVPLPSRQPGGDLVARRVVRQGGDVRARRGVLRARRRHPAGRGQVEAHDGLVLAPHGEHAARARGVRGDAREPPGQPRVPALPRGALA